MNKKVVNYTLYERAQARYERTLKRLIIAVIISTTLVFASNAIWLYAWMQYDYTSEDSYTETVNVDGKDGVANYIGNDNNGDINNGESDSN